MSKIELGSTPVLQCRHCGNSAPLTIEAQYSTVKSYPITDDPYVQTWEIGTIYDVLTCPVCSKVSFSKYEYHEAFEESCEYQILYPTDQRLPTGLPKPIQREYEAAQKVKGISPTAYGILLRRILEMVCADRKASGKTLYDKLMKLAANGELPANLVEVADGVRIFGNIAAHDITTELTNDEVALLDDLSRAVLEYVYSAPLLAKKVRDHKAKPKPGKTAANP